MTIISPSVYTDRFHLSYDAIAAVVEQSYDGILVIDGNATVVLVNDAYFRITGLKKAAIIMQNFREFIKSTPFRRPACLEALETQKTFTQTHYDVVPGKVIMVTASPIFDNNGNVCLVVANCRDISEMVSLREQLERALEVESFFYQGIETEQSREPIAVSTKMRTLYANALKVSSVDIPVLITGESGSGKEVLAKYIHENSPRKHAPFVAVNCGAIPENLLESEFFGYNPGSFTGAAKTGKKGLFETANGGTLFLDEIGDMPFNLQVKLLRALDTGEITRIGSNETTPVNVRILAATNKNIDILVNSNKFRIDLYYRLNAINLAIPPLRERPEDIRPLCMFFLNKYNKQYGLAKKLSHDVIKILEGQPWPGNIRQLRYTVECMAVLSTKSYLELSALPEETNNRQASTPIKTKPHAATEQISSLKQAVATVEKTILSKAVQQYSSSRQIAKVVGVDQTTVLRKLKKYGLHINNPNQPQP